MADRIRNIFMLTTGILGIFFAGAPLTAGLFGLDITPGFGMIQMIQFLVGVSLLTLSGFIYINHLREDEPRSLQADIGVRLGATGLIFAFVSGLSDLVGIGTHTAPAFARPFVGPFQLAGLGVSVGLIIVGMILFHTSKGNGRNSLLGFIAPDESA
ncbi:MAG: hypothetical protein ACI9EW_001249 [Cellvibrionaceae bacterium]|jgi:hypothetical protein